MKYWDEYVVSENLAQFTEESSVLWKNMMQQSSKLQQSSSFISTRVGKKCPFSVTDMALRSHFVRGFMHSMENYQPLLVLYDTHHTQNTRTDWLEGSPCEIFSPWTWTGNVFNDVECSRPTNLHDNKGVRVYCLINYLERLNWKVSPGFIFRDSTKFFSRHRQSPSTIAVDSRHQQQPDQVLEHALSFHTCSGARPWSCTMSCTVTVYTTARQLHNYIRQRHMYLKQNYRSTFCELPRKEMIKSNIWLYSPYN